MFLYVQIHKINKTDPKNQKFENLSTIQEFHFDLGPNILLGQRNP